MRLSISNIAWDVGIDTQAAEIFSEENVYCIDIAPGKYFNDIASVTDDKIKTVKSWWQDHGISIVAMQSLLYGTQGLNLFDITSQPAMLAHLRRICHIGAVLGANKLVFGSPKNRDRQGLNDDKAEAIALDFYNRLGNTAKDEGVVICLEANPVCYGTNFLTNTKEAADFVSKLDHPHIRLQLDLGTIYTNHESAESILNNAHLFGHIHLSEKGMACPQEIVSDTEHKDIAEAFVQMTGSERCPTNIASIEMLVKDSKNDSDTCDRLRGAIRKARTLYGIKE